MFGIKVKKGEGRVREAARTLIKEVECDVSSILPHALLFSVQ